MPPISSERLYAHRFSPEQRDRKQRVWRVLCADFLQRYISPDAELLDLGAGYGEFLNNIAARRKVGIDMNPELRLCVGPDVEALSFDVTSGDPLPGAPYDVVFASNFLEHLRDKDELTALVARVYQALRPGGTFLVMGPNIRFLRGQYWDFYDHHIPLSDRSVSELLSLSGFKIAECLPQFLPYTMKSRFPSWGVLVRAYLRVPMAWHLFGGQFFVVAKKRMDQ